MRLIFFVGNSFPPMSVVFAFFPSVSCFLFFLFFKHVLMGDWLGRVSHTNAFQLTWYHVRSLRFATCTPTRHCEICVPYGTFTGYRVLKTSQKWKWRYIEAAHDAAGRAVVYESTLSRKCLPSCFSPLANLPDSYFSLRSLKLFQQPPSSTVLMKFLRPLGKITRCSDSDLHICDNTRTISFISIFGY